jgi:hypothetical protein
MRMGHFLPIPSSPAFALLRERYGEARFRERYGEASTIHQHAIGRTMKDAAPRPAEFGVDRPRGGVLHVAPKG